MLLYRINQEAEAKQHAATKQNRPVLTPEEFGELLKQLENERGAAAAERQDDPHL